MDKKTIFNFADYRLFLKNYLKEMPKSHGALKAWAEHLKVHSTLISQVMMGKRDFTEEQALELCDFLGLSTLEKDYFLELLRLERAGTTKLKKYHHEKIRELSAKALKLSERIETERKLTEQESSIFYSSWMYSAVRLCCSIGEGQTIDEISEKLQIPRAQVLIVIEFLRKTDFVKQNGARFEIGSQYTHLGKGSPFLNRHHLNWRVKALQKIDHTTDEELIYTAPFSISEKDFAVLREQLVGVIQQFLKTVKSSEGETVALFTMDLLKLTQRE
jgi:uncharacterized protein (TIGR02147 family)